MGRYFLIKTGDFSRNAIVDYSKKYLTFEALEDGTFSFTNDIDYSIDDGQTWTTLAANTESPTITTGNKILWKGQLKSIISGIGTFSSTGRFNVYGNVMSLIYSDNFKGKYKIPYTYCFESLFQESQTVYVHNLILPATTLANNCYGDMFNGCTSLVTAPELPATTLTERCYYEMFRGCTSLVTAPELPATTLTERCYTYMFSGCTSLVTAPELPATTLATSCYLEMFEGCTSLTTVPSILPATTLTNSCYSRMFEGCTSLVTAPELPATTLADWCCNAMFQNCTSLTVAPSILPATTLTDSCYKNMFYYCTSLTTAPELPALTLVTECYYHMFTECHNLNYIKMLATDISASQCLYDWVHYVSGTGTFVKNANATWDKIGGSGVPYGWTIITQ